jgi:DNA-directed RNA polymerase specialized sigma24 family protein
LRTIRKHGFQNGAANRGETEDAEDAAQDSLQRAFTHFKSFKGDRRFSTWLSRIVTNAALMRLCKNSVRRELSFDELSISQPDFSPFEVEGQGLNPSSVLLEMSSIVCFLMP